MLGAVIGDLAGSIYEYDEFKSKKKNIDKRMEILNKDNLIEKNQISTILYNFNILIQYLSFSSILYKYVFNIIMKIKYSY